MNRSEKERLAVVETQISNIEQDVNEIKGDVKTLLRNGAVQKGKIGVWDRIVQIIVAAIIGGLCGKFWR